MNLFLILSISKTAMPIKISELLIDPLLWKIVGFVSSIVAFTCFALSPSFQEVFGRWNLFKGIIYSIVSLSVISMMLSVNECKRFTRSVMVKTIVGFLVMMLTSLYSIWQDLNSQNEEKGWHGRVLKLWSFGAFGLMSLSWSRQLELGFEVGISNFLFGSFLVLLMKMNFKLIPLAALICYVVLYIRYFSDHHREMHSLVDSSDTEPGDIETGTSHAINLRPLNVAEDFMHKNRLQEYADRSNIPRPIYQTVQVGLSHAPQFRSAVSVDGKSYASEHVSPNRRASEQDVAKLALKHITTGVKDEDLSLILERPISFKSLLNEYAQKMNLEITYDTVPHEGHGFLSSLDLNGEPYIGDPARNKKDAEQSAACAAVLSNLENFIL